MYTYKYIHINICVHTCNYLVSDNIADTMLSFMVFTLSTYKQQFFEKAGFLDSPSASGYQ